MVVAVRRIKPRSILTQSEKPVVIDFPARTPEPDFSSIPVETPDEIYEPTAEDTAFIGEALMEQYESEEAGLYQRINNGDGHGTGGLVYLADYLTSPAFVNGNGHANDYHNPTEEDLAEMRRMEENLKAEFIVEQAQQLLGHLKYVHFVSRSKGRYHSGNKAGQQKPRREWVEVELVSQGIEPDRFIGKGYRHRIFWSSSKFPWDEVADGIGLEEKTLMTLLPTLMQNAKAARKYLRTGAKPDYRGAGVINY